MSTTTMTVTATHPTKDCCRSSGGSMTMHFVQHRANITSYCKQRQTKLVKIVLPKSRLSGFAVHIQPCIYSCALPIVKTVIWDGHKCSKLGASASTMTYLINASGKCTIFPYNRLSNSLSCSWRTCCGLNTTFLVLIDIKSNSTMTKTRQSWPQQQQQHTPHILMGTPEGHFRT